MNDEQLGEFKVGTPEFKVDTPVWIISERTTRRFDKSGKGSRSNHFGKTGTVVRHSGIWMSVAVSLSKHAGNANGASPRKRLTCPPPSLFAPSLFVPSPSS
jgi:hypothetical protein